MFLLKWQKPCFVGLIKLVWPVTLLGGLNRSVTCQMLAVRWTQATKSYLLSSQAFHFKCLSPPDLIVALWTMAQSKYAICKKLSDKNDNLFRVLIILCRHSLCCWEMIKWNLKHTPDSGIWSNIKCEMWQRQKFKCLNQIQTVIDTVSSILTCHSTDLLCPDPRG